jgi:predicted DNA-binding ribbon-helix-helix protein
MIAEPTDHAIEARPVSAQADAAAAASLHLVDLRVVSHNGVRRAFKLERVFWKILEFAATSKKQRLGAYIAEIVGATGKDDNRTSLLRVHAAEWLSRRLIDSSAKGLAPKTLASIVLSVPSPCFSIDNENRITSQNEPFLKFLQPIVGDGKGDTNAAVRVTFQRDMKAIRELLKQSPRPFVDDRAVIQSASQRTECEARIVSLDTLHGRTMGLLVILAP